MYNFRAAIFYFKFSAFVYSLWKFWHVPLMVSWGGDWFQPCIWFWISCCFFHIFLKKIVAMLLLSCFRIFYSPSISSYILAWGTYIFSYNTTVKTVAIASWKITSYDHLKIIDHLNHFFDSCFLYNGEEYSIN
jgi:hypothetical protein